MFFLDPRLLGCGAPNSAMFMNKVQNLIRVACRLGRVFLLTPNLTISKSYSIEKYPNPLARKRIRDNSLENDKKAPNHLAAGAPQKGVY